ncbi:MAG: hypothetical protein Q4B28_02425 [bacterium]|nr:hypothetical protein [bacterium]
MIKKIVLFSVIMSIVCLAGCRDKQVELTPPELSPHCPEGFYWIDASKSCEILEDDFVI